MVNPTRIFGGYPFAVYVNETATKQRIAGGIYVDEAAVTGTSQNLTGVFGTGSAGTITVTYDTTLTLTGVSGTGSVGTFTIVVGPVVNLTGVQGTGSIGTFEIDISTSISLSGVQGTGTAAPFIIPTLGIVITEFPNIGSGLGQVFQRAPGLTTRDMNISGTYSGGSFIALNFSVNIVGGGTALTGACTNVVASGQTWTATVPTVPQGDDYVIVVTEPVSTKTSAQTVKWGIGVVILQLGQSNMVHMYSVVSGGTSSIHTRRWCGNGWWKPETNQMSGENESGGGEGNVNLLNLIQTGLGGTVPVGILEYGVAGVSISTFLTGQSSWNIITNGSTGISKAGCLPEFEMVIWHLGETPDGDVGSNPASYYAADLQLIYTQCQTLSGRNNSTLKFGIAMLGTAINGAGVSSSANFDTIRLAQWTAATTTTGMFYIGSTIDNIHDTTQYHWAHYLRPARRYANAILNQLGLSANGSKGPQISNAYWTLGTNQIVINVSQLSGGGTLLDGTGSNVGAGLTVAQSGFVVTASGGQTVSSIALSLGTIVITMSGNRGASETVSLTYGAGKNPWVWVANPAIDINDYNIYDNNSTLVSDTVGLVLLPSIVNGASITVSETNPALAIGGNAWMSGMGKMMNR